VLDGITSFVKEQDPDIVGLIEVDIGSVRSGMLNQAEHIADSLGHYSTYECKYGKSSINNLMPIVRKQGNAFLAAPRVEGERFHYFDTGIKRLIIELELDDVCIFLVHLALKYRQRQYQLRYLHDLIAKSHKPVIVTGDFNTFWGTHEIYLFMRAPACAAPTRRTCRRSRRASRASSSTSCWSARKSKSPTSRCRTCASPITVRSSATSPSAAPWRPSPRAEP
jgi:endonuclease/exonuclease/phosphatase family metal-dependent hydrolase